METTTKPYKDDSELNVLIVSNEKDHKIKNLCFICKFAGQDSNDCRYRKLWPEKNKDRGTFASITKCPQYELSKNDNRKYESNDDV